MSSQLIVWGVAQAVGHCVYALSHQLLSRQIKLLNNAPYRGISCLVMGRFAIVVCNIGIKV